MLAKPEHLGPEYAGQFLDKGVAEAYPHRPPYPREALDMILSLISGRPRIVLDLGCGTGDVARRIAEGVDRVDAVDPSRALIEVGRFLPGGDDWRIRWIQSTAEQFSYADRYPLICAAESLQWMDWEIVLRKIAGALTRSGKFLIVRRVEDEQPWRKEIHQLLAKFSTCSDFEEYDLVGELIERNLIKPHSETIAQEIVHTQSICSYVESFHSRIGFSRQRMGKEAAAEFDREMWSALEHYAYDGYLEYTVAAEIVWAVPL